MVQLSDSVGFWGSGEGIGMRLEMLGSAINTGSYNNALQVAASVYGVQYFKMAGPEPICKYCTTYYGRIYLSARHVYAEFPAHPNCFHEWDVWFPWEEESEFSAFWNHYTQPQTVEANNLY
jgi:hypothetical protein